MSGQAYKIALAQKAVRDNVKAMVDVMGTDALNHFTKSFRNQGFEDENIQRWAPRKGEISGGIARVRKRDRGSRAILIKSGALRKSLFKYRSGITSVTIKSGLPYAQIHNDGLWGKAWGKHPFKMPKRQFVGYSGKLNRSIIKKMDIRIKRIFQ